MRWGMFVAIDQEPYAPDHQGIFQGLVALDDEFEFFDPTYNAPTPDQLVEQCVEYRPDIVVHGMTNTIAADIPKRIKEALPRTKQVFCMWDFRPNDSYEGLMDIWKESAPYLNLVTLSNKTQIPYWQEQFKVPVQYFPHGSFIPDKLEYDPELAHPVVFTGSRHESGPFGERVLLIDNIDNLLKPHGIGVTWINAHEREERNKIWQSLPRLYHSSDICLDISHFWDTEGYASGRSFYMSSLGGCAVTKRFPGCEKLWPEGTKWYFDTPEEAVKLILDLRADPERIRKTKLEAWRYAQTHHHYQYRLNQLKEWLR